MQPKTLEDYLVWFQTSPGKDEDGDDLVPPGEGCAILSDDYGNWVIASSGWQSVSEEEVPMTFTFIVEPHDWQPTILEALKQFYIEYHKRNQYEAS